MRYNSKLNYIYSLAIILLAVLSTSCMGKAKNSYNSESDISYSTDFMKYTEDLTEYVADLTEYTEDSTNYIEDLTDYTNNLTYQYFGEYTDGIYSVQLQSQEYIKAYLEINGNDTIDIEKIIAQLTVGTGTIIITAIVLPAVPLIAGVSSTTVYATRVCIVAINILKEAFFGAALDAAISGAKKYYETNRDIEQTFYSAIEHASEGFMWGTIISSGMETVKEVKFVHQSIKEKKAVAEAFKCEINTSKTYLSEKSIDQIIKDNTDDLIKVLKQVPEDKKELVYRFFTTYPDDAANLYAKYQDDILNIFEKIGKNDEKKLLQIFRNLGEDAFKALSEVTNKNPKELSNAIEWISIKGKDGTYDVLKWGGKIPKWVTKETIEIARKSATSSLKASAESLLKLPSIKLTTGELDLIRQNPANLHEIVTKYTGKIFSDGYLEFFVRLSKRNPQQMEEIWNYSKAVRDFIKNEGIRAGGVHEWLMCEHFCNFLTDEKWSRDGAYLCELLSNLTQPTNSVVIENLTITLKDGSKEFYPIWNHLLESQKTLGNASNPRSVIHNLIRDVVEKSNSTEELIANLDKMVETNFTKETYELFSKALADCLK